MKIHISCVNWFQHNTIPHFLKNCQIPQLRNSCDVYQAQKWPRLIQKNDDANTLSMSVWAPKTPLISNLHQIGWLCLHLFLGLRAGYPHTRMQKWRHTICSAVTKVLCNMTVLVSSRWPVCYFLKKRMCPRKLIHFKYN